ncbi:MAG TPA: nucleotidyltransferase family protein [Ktedonobacterales bacterium]|jgi:hypothetical protein|nr:nucleotidyltransferase family protein [Ktedonobacterales bacterium]
MDQIETASPSTVALQAIARLTRSSEARDLPRLLQALWSIGSVGSPEDHTPLDEAALGVSFLPDRLNEADWRQLLALAQVHGMAPLVFWRLANAGLLATVPAPIVAAFKDEYLQTLINNRRMQTVFREVVAALGAAGVAVMPLKGLALAHRYYENLALRPMTDMDLLVRREDVSRAASTLRGLGFSAADGMGTPSGFYSMTSAVVVYARPRSLTIEIHWELFGRHAYRPSLPAAVAWARAQRISLFEQQVRYLQARDELWYLCIHAAVEHRLERLIWLVDIARLVVSLPPDWDWQVFARETAAAGVALPVAAALGYGYAYLRLPLPVEVLERLNEAADAPTERATCAAAQTDLMSAEWIQMAATSAHSVKEKAIVLRGVLAPRRATLSALYGHDAERLRDLPRAYARHWRRTVAPTIRALSSQGATPETRPRPADGLR